MSFVNQLFIENIEELNKSFNSKKPFRYLEYDGFLKTEIAEEVYNNYPKIDPNNKSWDGTTYLDQKNKFTKTKFEENSIFYHLFNELNSDEFTSMISKITEIKNICGDHELFGGGLHQSINGAFLNVHVNYNFHPTTKYHRRCNLIVYLNKNWKDEYNGHLELWDFTKSKKGNLIERISPEFNKAVIFETNEISYHGHPHPLNTPNDINRKSLALYYYSKERPTKEISSEHNTIYKNTTGTKGNINSLKNGVKAILERIKN